jgi:predicted secreted Zn-dependent protease
VRFLSFISALWLPAFALAQNTVQWTTNYYAVTGTTLGEIRDSLARSRPWKDKSSLDALTQWRIEWRYQFASSDAGCRCTSFTTKTTIAITLPRWTRSTNAAPETATHWDRYMTALRRHELGHAQIGLAAAAEQHKRINEVGRQTDCAALKKKIDMLAQQTVDDYGRRDRDYDERTGHGAKEGAVLSGRAPGSDGRRGP